MLKQRVMKHTWLKDFRALVVVALCALMLASSSDATLIAEAKGTGRKVRRHETIGDGLCGEADAGSDCRL